MFKADVYSIFIGCPGDVDGKLQKCVAGAIDDYNHTDGSVQKNFLIPINWKGDVFLKAGMRPQEVINEQIVDECDAAIITFWTRFGSPTGLFNAGAEEEFFRLLGNNKQIFTFFYDEAVSASGIELEQLKQVQEFKKKIQDKCNYIDGIKNETELQEAIVRQLRLYFSSLKKKNLRSRKP